MGKRRKGRILILLITIFAVAGGHTLLNRSVAPATHSSYGKIKEVEVTEKEDRGISDFLPWLDTEKNKTSDIADEAEDAKDTYQEPTNLDGPYTVEYVYDGDTFKINGEKIRLIGVDTPESVHRDESRNTEEGKIASNFSKDTLTGKDVYLEYDVQECDDYGRTLAYVYLDGKLYEDILLEKGYARAMTIVPNVKYADHFAELQRTARESNMGFWDTNPWGV